MIVKVYHADHELFREACCALDENLITDFLPDRFTLVAELGIRDTVSPEDALDIAFEYTNSIDRHWSENKGVRAIGEKTRSTSVGDVVEVDGSKFVVAGIGFKPIGG